MRRRALMAVLFLCVSVCAWAQDRPVHVQIDCRESIGLLPGQWRGLRLKGDVVPDDMSLRTVCLDPALVTHAWQMRRRGGAYDWRALDRVMNQLRARRISVVLPLPVPQVRDALWKELVEATVRHAGGRVDVFEFLAIPGADMDAYLEFYEAGAWAAYQVDAQTRVGGPGLDWQHEGVDALIRRCAERRLPLHVVTWQVDVALPDDPVRSAMAVQNLIARHRPASRPEGMITGWRVQGGEAADALALSLSGMMSVMTSNVLAMCLADTGDVAGWAAMRALNPLAGMRLPMVFQAPDGGISGVAHLEHDTVLALFWHSRPGGMAPMTVSFNGLPLGNRIEIEQLHIGQDGLVPVFADAQAFHEPISVDFTLESGVATLIRLVIE